MASAIDEFQFFLEKEWSDGFPVVTPTEERVAWMLTGTRRDPEETDPRCDLCGAPMLERHCKLVCVQCGYQRDCSDP